MVYTAPPRPWRKFLALIWGMCLLVIFAPSGSSPSTRERAKILVFTTDSVAKGQGVVSTSSNEGKDKVGRKRSSSVVKPSESADAAALVLDPSTWTHLSMPHSVLSNESIGEFQRQQEGILHTRYLVQDKINNTNNNSATEEGDRDIDRFSGEHTIMAYYDRWYVLDNVQQSSVSYQLRVAFPLETSVDVDLDVSVWTLASAQRGMPKDVCLADHYSESTSRMFARVRLTRLEKGGSLAKIDEAEGSIPSRLGSRLAPGSLTTLRRSSSLRSGATEARVGGGHMEDAKTVVFSLRLDRLYFGRRATHSGLQRGVAMCGAAAVVVAGAVALGSRNAA